MEIGIDSFAKKTQTNDGGTVDDDAKAMSESVSYTHLTLPTT